MSEKKRVAIVAQEMKPYLGLGELAKIARELPQNLQENKMEIRIFMPKFGSINERRHRLHEVVRLSGINIIIDEDDFPLIIKVASLPGARLQVYFLDNDDFFKRKHVYKDGNDKFYKDNPERMIFFCKGVLETIRKMGWSPDIIHCHGWMTSLIPLYIKTSYKNDPLFKNAQSIYSVYPNEFEDSLGDIFNQKAKIKKVKPEDLAPFSELNNTALHKGGIFYSDAVVTGTENVAEDVATAIADVKTEKPVLDFQPTEDGYLDAYRNFYSQLLATVEE